MILDHLLFSSNYFVQIVSIREMDAMDFHFCMVWVSLDIYWGVPRAYCQGFRFFMLIFAPDAAPYWSVIVRILGIAFVDVTRSVTSSA